MEAPSRPRNRLDFNLTLVVRALTRAQLLGDEQRQLIAARESSVRARLVRERGRGKPYEPSPIEIVAALNLPHPSRPGQLLDEDVLSEAAAAEAGVEYRKIDPLKLDMNLITRLLSRPFAERHAALPLETVGGVLRVAVANPFDLELVELLGQRSGGDVKPVLASKSDILRSIEHVYGFNQSVAAVAGGGFIGSQLADFEQLVRISGDKELDVNDKPVVAAVDHLFRYAFDNRASDIHLEPRRAGSAVRMRIDGVLHPVFDLPAGVHSPMVSRLKMLSRMDIAEKRRPQDGRIKTERGGREVELRVSTVPTAFGEKSVIRIFDPDVVAQDLADLGFFPEERALFESWIARPHGLILVTGPTGSGKSTTLYSSLRALAGPDINVTTVEDPIEMVFEGLNQIQVQPRIELDFAQALRHILRQDPDVIMIGEIRDRETAHAAVQSALTGHLVISTLHTNSAAEAITRMADLGVERFLLSSSLVGVMAQRLVRNVCPHCSEPVQLTDDELKALEVPLPEGAAPRRGMGCQKCRQTGYRGRSALFELVSVTAPIRELIATAGTTDAITRRAREDQGMTTLRESGARRVALGETTVEEVVRITST